MLDLRLQKFAFTPRFSHKRLFAINPEMAIYKQKLNLKSSREFCDLLLISEHLLLCLDCPRDTWN